MHSRLIALAVSITLLVSGCAIVMNRKFGGESKLYHVAEGFSVGVPVALALRSCVNRELWDHQDFTFYLPMLYGRKYEDEYWTRVEEAVDNGILTVESLTVTFLSSGRQAILKPKSSRYLHREEGTVLFTVDQHYGGESHLVMVFENLTIPTEEKRIQISFTVKVGPFSEKPVVEKVFSFILRRQEGKKLVVDPGR